MSGDKFRVATIRPGCAGPSERQSGGLSRFSRPENWLRHAALTTGVYFFRYVILVVTTFPLKANGACSK